MFTVLAVLLFSIVLHEVAHGYSALKFGDTTARDQGRLTLNPLPHLDLFGSILLPTILYLMGGFIFAWAKPVPVNFRILSPNKLGIIVVSMAGIIVNFGLAILAAVIFRFLEPTNPIAGLFLMIVLINLILAIFNLMPIPPLDGSKLWLMWLSEETQMRIQQFSMMFFFFLIIILPHLPVFKIVSSLFQFLTGRLPSFS